MWPFISAEDKLLGIKKIKINGVLFTIKKIDLADHLSGYNVLANIYDSWNNKKSNEINTDIPIKKTKEFYRDIFLRAVVKPKLSKNSSGTNICVDDIFSDWDMAHKLFFQILSNTLKKKTLKRIISQKSVL